MKRHNIKASRGRGSLAGVLLAAVAALVLAVPALAWEAEGGTINCGNRIGYTHARYYDVAAIEAPGGPTSYFLEDDNAWHWHEVNGHYSGDWQGLGDPYLDLGATYAGCRNYGVPVP